MTASWRHVKRLQVPAGGTAWLQSQEGGTKYQTGCMQILAWLAMRSFDLLGQVLVSSHLYVFICSTQELPAQRILGDSGLGVPGTDVQPY